MAPSITDYEVSIIKGMLRMGYSPALVQSYFTRPGRLVNPARIQEIKSNSTARIAEIEEATDEDVGYFIDDFSRSSPEPDHYAPPAQEVEITQFTLDANGKVTVLSNEDDVQLGTPEIREIYDELRLKSLSLRQHGHNSLGEIHTDISSFTEALPEDPLKASIVRLFMRGSKLKSLLASYEKSQENPDHYPLVEMSSTAAPLVRDLVDSFTLLVNLTPAMAVLEAKAASQEDYVLQGDALHAIKPALEDADQVADTEAYALLDEQVDKGISAPSDHSGRAQRSVAFSSVRNFAISIVTPVYHAARYVLGDDKLPSILQSLRNGAVTAAGNKLYSYLHDRFPAVVEYIGNHSESIINYAEKIITNPQLQDFIRSMVEAISRII